MKATTTTPVKHLGVGIDTARYGHRVTFLHQDRQLAAPSLTVLESPQGYQQLRDRLEELHRQHPQAQFHVHIDAAGQYATNLEQFLRELPLPLVISVGEPKRNKDYQKAFFPKRTTDDTESQAMARFAVVEQPAPTSDLPNEFYVLREVAGRLQARLRDTTRATNRLHNLLARVFPELATLVRDLAAQYVVSLLKKYPTPERLAQASIDALKQIPYLKPQLAEKIHTAAKDTVGSLRGTLAESLVVAEVKQLEQALAGVKQLENLLLQAFRALPRTGHIHITSVPGIGLLTAAVLVAKVVSIERFSSPEKLVGYFGIFPETNLSGVDPLGNPLPAGTQRMSTKGSDLVRRYLWNAAKSAIQHNPAVRDLYARLRARGTRGDVALGHCMRKLLHQVFGVWASDRPFDEQLSQPRKTRLASPPSSAQLSTDGTLPPTETPKAAGHKRVACPQKKVVTAATSNIKPSPAAVKHLPPEQAGAIDYAHLRQQIRLETVLSYLGCLDHLRGTATQRRGACPLHGGQGPTFSVNLKKNVFRCFKPGCHQGNVLDFWQHYHHHLSPHAAAWDLAQTFHLQTQPTSTEKRNP
jgi:transposase